MQLNSKKDGNILSAKAFSGKIMENQPLPILFTLQKEPADYSTSPFFNSYFNAVYYPQIFLASLLNKLIP
jgi:hypothetical protein